MVVPFNEFRRTQKENTGGGSRNSVLCMLHKVLVIGLSGHGEPTIGYMSVKVQI